MSKFAKFKELENSLEKKYKNKKENEASLGRDDFKDGKITISGYNNLKQQCEYIDYREDIEIKVPKGLSNGFKDSFERMAADEISHIKKDILDTEIKALAFFGIGVVIFVLAQLFVQNKMILEMMTIATWVFVWTAIEKWVFKRTRKIGSKLSLLQIAAAKVKEEEKE